MKVLLFTADWCQPCQAMKPVIKEVAENCSVDYEFINVETEDPRMKKYLVMSTPTIVIEESGRISGCGRTQGCNHFS